MEEDIIEIEIRTIFSRADTQVYKYADHYIKMHSEGVWIFSRDMKRRVFFPYMSIVKMSIEYKGEIEE